MIDNFIYLTKMDRRSLLKQLTVASGAAVFSSSIFQGCRSDTYELQFMTSPQFDLLDDLSEIILPDTDRSPGARAAKVSHFVDAYIHQCVDEKTQLEFASLLTDIDAHSNKQFNSNFESLTPEHKIVVMTDLEKNKAYLRFKPIILFAYFTSKVGVTEALKYLPVPGKYEGHVLYAEGDRAWG